MEISTNKNSVIHSSRAWLCRVWVINRFLNEFEQPTELTNETLKPSPKAFKRALKAGRDETLAETVTKIYYLTYSFPSKAKF